jgi:CO/xanthine dehydrogenase Mo-binding subunit
MRLVSIAVSEAVERLLARGRAIAAHILQQSEASRISYAEAAFTAPGGGSVGLWDAARAAETLDSLPEDLRGVLTGEGGTTPALGLVVNAIVDALSEYGVTHY